MNPSWLVSCSMTRMSGAAGSRGIIVIGMIGSIGPFWIESLWIILCGCFGRRCGRVGKRSWILVIIRFWRALPRIRPGLCSVSLALSVVCPFGLSLLSYLRSKSLLEQYPSSTLWSCGPIHIWIFIVIVIFSSIHKFFFHCYQLFYHVLE